jgi:hypothetical protein
MALPFTQEEELFFISGPGIQDQVFRIKPVNIQAA